MCGKLIKEAENNINILYIVFCEDKLTLSMENCIADNLRSHGTFNIKVCTFSRYLSKKVQLENVLSKEGAAMAIRRIIFENSSNLLYLAKKTAKNTAESVYELIAQLKSAKITPKLLKTFSGNDNVLKNKLADIIFIYEKYNELLQQGYYDESSYLELLPEIIENDKDLENAKIYLTGFSSFTRQAAAVIESLIRKTISVCGIFCGGQQDVYTNEANDTFLRVCAELGISPKTIESSIEINKEADTIINGIYNPFLFSSKTSTETKNVFLYEASNYEDEIKYICEQIRYEVDENNLRYKDIAVCADLMASEMSLKKYFNEYNIPCFYDDNKNLSQHPLSRLLIDYLQIVETDFSVFNCINFIKNVFFCEDRLLTDNFENYILRYNNYRGFIKKELYIKDEKAKKYEDLRKNAFNLIKISKKMTAKEYSTCLKNLLIEINVEEKIKNISNILTELNDQSVSFNQRIYENIVLILDEICTIMPNVILNIEEFKSILLSGMIAKKISLIPAYFDAVFIGGYDSKIINTKVLFCLNLTSSVPLQKADTAFISDKDIIKLKNFDVVIEPKIAVVNLRQRENTGIILSSFSNRLYLSYSLIDNKNKEQRKSELITYIKKMFLQDGSPINAINRSFLNNNAENNDNFYSVYRFTSPLPALKNFISDALSFKEGKKNDLTAASSFYHIADENLKKEADRLLKMSDVSIAQKIECGKELFIKNNSLSTTLLQGFFECPYKNFLHLGLQLRDRELSTVRPNDSGNFLHYIMEKAFEVIDSLTDKTKIDLFCNQQTEILLQNEPYLTMKKNPASYQSILRLSKEACRIISAIIHHNSVTAFKPLAREVKFGYEGSQYPPLKLNANNTSVNLYGIIDRLDISDNFIRIIDYKSGKICKNDLFSDYYAGKKLQLWLYLNAVKSGYTPCGGYYFDLNNDFTEGNDIDNYKMTGITLFDDEVLQKTDSELIDKGLALTVNIKNDKSKLKGDILTYENFENYLNYSILISENATKEIIDGIIIPSPYKECGYCNYQGVCGYDENNGRTTRVVENIKAETISTAVQLKKEDCKL